ncbi:hypothetical protein [Akkermansia sp.]|uniref:hypothetical protein n=1 Tax=Akkermansia sp. TaxID=1872421 RepID=UPI003A8FF13B
MRRFFQGKSGFRQHGPGGGRDVSARSNGNAAFFPAVFYGKLVLPAFFNFNGNNSK